MILWRPGQCECGERFAGAACSACAAGHYGRGGCDVFCNATVTCSAEGSCSSTGACDCYDGWYTTAVPNLGTVATAAQPGHCGVYCSAQPTCSGNGVCDGAN